MNYQKEECEHMKREKEEEHQRLLEELGVKTTMAVEFENEVITVVFNVDKIHFPFWTTTKNPSHSLYRCKYSSLQLQKLSRTRRTWNLNVNTR